MELSFPLTPWVGFVLAVLSLPHVFYFLVWTNPSPFMSMAKKVKVPALELFYKISVGLKFVQFGTLAFWGFKTFPPFSLGEVSLLRIALTVVLGSAGQILNAGVYKALGKAGVYYGCKFGLSIPWYHGFPFTVVKHPQYVGCILTIWALVSLFFTQAVIDLGLLTVACGWTAFYVFSGFIENYF